MLPYFNFAKKLRQINENNFDEIALEVFQFQSEQNTVYRAYLKQLKFNKRAVQSINEVPFLPIQFFKSHIVKTGEWPSQRVFQSSGTSQQIRSAHHLNDEAFYLNHARSIFEKQIGSLTEFRIIALLPYYDTTASSLISMIKFFVAQSGDKYSGFYEGNPDKIIPLLGKTDKKTLLLGVSHALLDFVENEHFNFPNLMVMETGGMKGRRVELTRPDLHNKIKAGLGTQQIFSEYGMTELLSQAYAKSDGVFQCPSSMRVVTKEIADPFSISKGNGVLNVIDLANFHSCAFIETQDLGKVTDNGFEVLGRADNSEVRGCNLLIA